VIVSYNGQHSMIGRLSLILGQAFVMSAMKHDAAAEFTHLHRWRITNRLLQIVRQSFQPLSGRDLFVRDWPRIAGQHLSDCLFAPRSSSKCLSSASSNPSRFCGAGDASGVRTLQSSSTPQRVCCSSLTDCRSLSRPNGAIPALRRPPVRRQLPESPFYWVQQRLELAPWL